ncbi:hypothetical protein [Trinickia dinghuensis]|uniref:Uncharacterized protein n=1 Tax=Trinickia dinghuensis TaxID=2291023 RepID=A0A3D8K1E3_9BURK|nr:hypothetical protein [Trinickia dinghuensis]RDU98930.1 hypothetical protein DWV00_11845 [Trinickia dinghuensis]
MYLANEGKNRVALYQELKLPMPADVWSSEYIAPQRMALIERDDEWAVQLDDREIRTIRYCADIIVPMLAAYGVATLQPQQLKAPETNVLRRVLRSLAKR